MLRAAFGTRKPSVTARANAPPSWIRSWFQQQVIPFIQALSRRACTHPIHTLVFIAFMASAGYVGLLEGDLFEPPTIVDAAASRADFTSLSAGSQTLHASHATGWRWQNGKDEALASQSFQV